MLYKTRPTRQTRSFYRSFYALLSRKKTKTKTADPNLYSVVVRAVDKITKRVKIYYVGYSEQFDEWRARGCETDNPFQRMEPIPCPCSSSLYDRLELVHGEL